MRKWILLLVFSSSSLLAEEKVPGFPPEAPYTPWFTGPLLAPTGTILTRGHFSIQPYFYANVVTGLYRSHWNSKSTPNFYNETLQIQAIVGLTDFMDITISPEVLHNHTQGQSSTRFGDFPIEFDFLLLTENRFRYFPGIKLGIIETFPTGKYQKLNPKKLETDVGGGGSFSTTAEIVFYKVYHLYGHHYLSTIASFEYTYSAPVHVKGENVFNGGPGTRGKVYPGGSEIAFLSFEYSLTRNWVLALDSVYKHTNKDRFKGTPGSNRAAGRPSSELLSFAPAIEYNFNEHLGLIGGVWFSAAGRNTLRFCNGVISFIAQY